MYKESKGFSTYILREIAIKMSLILFFRKAGLFTRYNFLNNPFKPSTAPTAEEEGEETTADSKKPVLPFPLAQPWQDAALVNQKLKNWVMVENFKKRDFFMGTFFSSAKFFYDCM